MFAVAAVFSLGIQELIVILAFTVVPLAAGLLVLIMLLRAKKKDRDDDLR